MSRRKYIVEMVANMLNTNPTTAQAEAEAIIDRLNEEGVLNLGYGDADVERVVQTFSDTFGTTKASKTDRFAAHRLAAKYSPKAVCGIITLLGKNSQEKYAPVINSVTELEQKWVSVLNFVRNLQPEGPVDG